MCRIHKLCKLTKIIKWFLSVYFEHTKIGLKLRPWFLRSDYVWWMKNDSDRMINTLMGEGA